MLVYNPGPPAWGSWATVIRTVRPLPERPAQSRQKRLAESGLTRACPNPEQGESVLRRIAPDLAKLYMAELLKIFPASPEFWGAAVYVVAVFGICWLMLGLSWLLGGRSGARARNEQFESGVVSASPERLRLSAKFYLVAVFFVIFDVEALFLYSWAVSVREVGWPGFIEAALFVAVLGASLVYLVRIGALDWAPRTYRRRASGDTH